MKKCDSAGSEIELTRRVLADSKRDLEPATSSIAAILRIVPASHWAFAQIEPGGELRLFGSPSNPAELGRLKYEYARQRERVKGGPRIAATIGPLGEYESGVTLVFADAHNDFGLLVLLRANELGAFTSSEISMLRFALDATSQRFSALRRNAPAQNAAGLLERRSEGAFYVLDRDLNIVLAWTAEDQRRAALTGLRTRLADRLPAVIEDTVRELIAGWRDDPVTQEPGIAHPAPFLVVRTQPMSGPAGVFVGVRVDRFQPPNSLSGPAARFRISPRELQVLALLLDGEKLDQIGGKLHITSSTVQDHIKSMVEKTGSRNRTELIARVLGWENA